jgi:protocatechuate 4,5-dioxygenase alpha subunit
MTTTISPAPTCSTPSVRAEGTASTCSASLLKKANRDEFKADEAKYLDRYKLTSAQREAILKRQWNRMLELVGNIYITAKLGATDGLSF